MAKKLWFIAVNNEVTNVYDDPEVAQDELFYMREDNLTDAFKIYCLLDSDLDSYDDEFALAVSENFIKKKERLKW